MKKLLISLLAGSLVASMLSGCGGSKSDAPSSTPADGGSSTADAGEKVSIRVWTGSLSGDPFDGYFADLKKSFEAENPDIELVFEDIPLGEMEDKVMTSLTTNEVPDVVNLNPHFIGNIAKEGGLLKLDDLVGSISLSDTFLEGPLESCKMDGSLYALPWYLTTMVSWYNGTDFDAASVDTVPSTYADLLTTSRKIQKATKKPVYYPIINDGNVVMEKMVSLANGTPLVKDGVAQFSNHEALLDYFSTIQTMFKEELIPQEAVQGAINVGQELYMANKISLIEGGVTFLGPIEEGAPEIFKASRSGQPICDPQAPVNVAVMNFAIPAKSKHPEQAARVAIYLTNAQNQLKFAQTAGSVMPATKESLSDPYFTNPGDSPKARGLKMAAESLSRARVLIPPTENSATLRESTKNIFVENMQGALTPKEALTKLEKAWTDAFAETGEQVTF